jgi:hypothetical protein
MISATRRRILTAAAASVATPALARPETLRLGVLTPLTGAGGFDGPRMLKAMQAVATEINAAGGVLGRDIELVVEDDETNPEAAVRAAHKLTDVDRVPAIMGTWASYCLIQECSRADRVLPHQDAPVAAPYCQSGPRRSRFPVRSGSLLSRPDLAPLEPRRAAEGKRGAEPPGATRSAIFRASMARMASTGPSPKRAPWHTPHQSDDQAAAAPLTSVT